jgi:separase
MFEMGLKEAKSLKWKLMGAGSGTVGGKEIRDRTKVEGTYKGSEVEKEPFSKLLEFRDVVTTGPAFPLVVACQLGMLRCVSGLKRPELVEVS